MNGHWLEVTGHPHPDYEIAVHHPADCPTETSQPVEPHPSDSPAVAEFLSTPATWRTCGVQHELDHGGLDSLDAGRFTVPGVGWSDGVQAWRRLPPGWYEIEAWHSGPSIVNDYDGGLRIVRGPFPGPPGTVAYSMAVLRQHVAELIDAARFSVELTLARYLPPPRRRG